MVFHYKLQCQNGGIILAQQTSKPDKSRTVSVTDQVDVIFDSHSGDGECTLTISAGTSLLPMSQPRDDTGDGRLDHDKLFKSLISRYFHSFMELFLPDLAEQMDPDYVKFLDKEVQRGKSMVGDLLVEVRLESEAEPVLIHVECQASRVQDYSRKMLDYNTCFYTKYNQKVVSVVVYSYPSNADEPSRYLMSVAGRRVMEFHFDVVHLCRKPWRHYVDQPNPIAAGFLAKMQYEHDERFTVRLEFYRMLTRLDLTREELTELIQFHESYLVFSEEEELIFRQLVHIEREERVMEMMISFVRMGRKDREEEIAKKLLEKGYSLEDISSVTDLPIEKVERLM